ncbi:YbjN domain-containing protein [Micromonospora sp. SH-82]|uniref:YbjN domain-containing protein n=1 Tax=Micromonospora sp. SH-82 TaxID=3132938 RepID=UPI003EBC7CCE
MESPVRSDDPLGGHPSTLRPLTDDLVAAVLAHRGYPVRTGPDGTRYARWGDTVVWFLRLGDAGELLQIRTVAAPTFDIHRVPQLHAFCDLWNHDQLWPKAFVHVDDAGRARVHGEVVTDLERGVTPHQLDRLVDRGVSAGRGLAAAVDDVPGGLR